MGEGIFTEQADLTLAGGPIRRYAAGPADGAPILLLHGAMLDTAVLTWHQVVPELARTHRIHAIDLPRHGGSRPWRGIVDQTRCERIIDELLDQLAIDTIALVGLSMGGGISLGYALTRPERVRAMVVAAPGGLGDRRPAQFLTWLGMRIPYLLTGTSRYLATSGTAIRRAMIKNLAAGERTEGFDTIVRLVTEEARLKAANRERALDDWQILAYGPRRMNLNFLPSLHHLTVPTRWLRGQTDPLVSHQEMVEAAGPALITIDGAGHLLPLDRPTEFAALTSSFLAAPNPADGS